jgi:hypothetical protein
MMPVRLNARNWPSFASVIQVAPPTPAPASEEHAQVQPAVPKRRRRRECVVRPPPRRIDPMMQTVDYRRVADTCALRADMKRAGQPEAIALLAPKPSAHALAIVRARSAPSHASPDVAPVGTRR